MAVQSKSVTVTAENMWNEPTNIGMLKQVICVMITEISIHGRNVIPQGPKDDDKP
jgi:hypothetical protein